MWDSIQYPLKFKLYEAIIVSVYFVCKYREKFLNIFHIRYFMIITVTFYAWFACVYEKY